MDEKLSVFLKDFISEHDIKGGLLAEIEAMTVGDLCNEFKVIKHIATLSELVSISGSRIVRYEICYYERLVIEDSEIISVDTRHVSGEVGVVIPCHFDRLLVCRSSINEIRNTSTKNLFIMLLDIIEADFEKRISVTAFDCIDSGVVKISEYPIVSELQNGDLFDVDVNRTENRDFSIKEALDTITNEQRKELFDEYCIYCGSKIKPCYCGNSEEGRY